VPITENADVFIQFYACAVRCQQTAENRALNFTSAKGETRTAGFVPDRNRVLLFKDL